MSEVDRDTSDSAERLPSAALALSFLSAGVGHVYCGRLGRGLALYCGWLLLPLASVLAAMLQPSLAVLVGLLVAPVLVIIGLYVFSAVDAFRLAGRVGKDYRIRDYNRPAIYLLLIAVGLAYPLGCIWGVRSFVLEAFVIPTRSMSPSIRNGDRILVNKLVAHARFPQRGDLIAFRSPIPTTATAWITRVIALPGDTVELRDGVVLVNGRELSRTPVPAEAVPELTGGEVSFETNAGRRYPIRTRDRGSLSDEQRRNRQFKRAKVPARSLFVLGDNRDLSRDSRSFGFIHAADVIGYPQYVFLPSGNWSRFGLVDRLPTRP